MELPRITILIFSFLLSFTVCSGNIDEDLHLELVQVLFRHGERTPLAKEFYPKDPHNVSVYEPWGIGQLTNEGKLREYQIGKMLRQRYNDYLGDVYYPRDVYALSTDVDRTKMSLQLVLAGLYPPAHKQIWNSQLPWLAIPTNYVPERLDFLLKSHTTATYIKALEEVKSFKNVSEEVTKFQDLFSYMAPHTGLNITSVTQVYEIYNLIVAQKSMNLTTPSWCTEDVFKQMQKATVLEYQIRSYTKKLKRLHSGMLIKRIMENMNFTGKLEYPRKIYLYSGHEVNIAAFARAHNLSKPEIPGFGSAIITEKLGDKKGNSYIRMLWWSGITEELTTYKLYGCNDGICSAETYLKMMNDIVPSNSEENNFWDEMSKEDLYKLYTDKYRYD